MGPAEKWLPYSTTQATRVERILLLCSSKIQNSRIHRSRFCCGREPVRKERLIVRIGTSTELKIGITHGNTGN